MIRIIVFTKSTIMTIIIMLFSAAGDITFPPSSSWTGFLKILKGRALIYWGLGLRFEGTESGEMIRIFVFTVSAVVTLMFSRATRDFALQSWVVVKTLGSKVVRIRVIAPTAKVVRMVEGTTCYLAYVYSIVV